MKIAVIGAGAMGGAVARGLAASRFTAPQNITVANPSPARLEPLGRDGLQVTSSNTRAVADAEIVFVAVKPWILPAVAAEILPALSPACREVCVIVAGVTCDRLAQMFPGSFSLAIGMPNTAISLGHSMTFIVPARGQLTHTCNAFSALGKCSVIDERLLPGATALASCGIAYAMRYVRAAQEGGVELGFSAAEAQQIVVQTIMGAAQLLAQPGSHPESEIDRVTTPGGITIKGLNAMEKAGFSASVVAGLKTSAGK